MAILSIQWLTPELPEGSLAHASLIHARDPNPNQGEAIVWGWALGPLGLWLKPRNTLYDLVPILDL